MKKLAVLFLLIFSYAFQAQTTANRFFYELTFKPKKDSLKMDKVMTVLDIIQDKSIFRDYTSIAQDSIMKAKIEEMQRTHAFKDMTKMMKMPKFAFKITKKYPNMIVEYGEPIVNGMSQMMLAYDETPKFDWKIQNEKLKIGEYNTQKATTEFGGRKWNAWFSTDIPLQDGPYKFYGLPGLIVKIEDTNKNYSWELKGNKKVNNFSELTEMEKMQSGGKEKVTVVQRDKFEKAFNTYKSDPFASIRDQLKPEMMSQRMPGSDKTIGEIIKDGEKRMKDFYSANDNPIEISTTTPLKK